MNVSKKSLSRATILALGALIVAVGFTACNTIEGAGQDMKSTGKAIEKTADDNK
jgi:entericidin B